MLFNEVSFLIAGIGLISSLIFWVTNPQSQLELQIVRLQTQVESNLTVQAALQEIKANDLNEINIRLDQMEARQIEILRGLARLEAIHTK
jgi:hypothetical protein